MNQPGSKAAADAATAQSAADRLVKIRPSESYADSVYDAYGSLPKGQLWRDLDVLIAAARAGVPEGWRPIETLKHHEWRGSPGLFQIIIACFHVHEDEDGPTGEVSLSWAHVVYASHGEKWMTNTAGWAEVHGNASFPVVASRATHWQPLPPTPVQPPANTTETT